MAVRMKGFTRQEVLTSMIVLLLLASILAPAFARIREVSKTQLCQYQLTTLGQKCLMFANESDGELPEPSDSSFIAFAFNLTREDLGLEFGTGYYSYYSDYHPSSNNGPTGLGYLWKHHLIESGSDLPFCPGMNKLFGVTTPVENWNPHGEPTHWNFCGKVSYGGTFFLIPEDEHIDWLPMRLTYGARKLSYTPSGGPTYGTNKLAELDPSKGFLSDLWCATDRFGQYWKTRETDLNHVDGSNRIINTWYLDGHVSGVVIGPEFFVEQDGVNYLSPNATWTTMLDGH